LKDEILFFSKAFIKDENINFPVTGIAD